MTQPRPNLRIPVSSPPNVGPMCQQINLNQQIWQAVPQNQRIAWTSCLLAVQELEKQAEIQKLKRNKWANRMDILLYMWTGLINIFTASQVIFYAVYDNPTREAITTIAVVNAIVNAPAWIIVKKRVFKYLKDSIDLKQVEKKCKEVRLKLRGIMEDGRIDLEEFYQLKNMTQDLSKMQESISGVGSFFKLWGESKDNSIYTDMSAVITQLEQSNHAAKRNISFQTQEIVSI